MASDHRFASEPGDTDDRSNDEGHRASPASAPDTLQQGKLCSMDQHPPPPCWKGGSTAVIWCGGGSCIMGGGLTTEVYQFATILSSKGGLVRPSRGVGASGGSQRNVTEAGEDVQKAMASVPPGARPHDAVPPARAPQPTTRRVREPRRQGHTEGVLGQHLPHRRQRLSLLQRLQQQSHLTACRDPHAPNRPRLVCVPLLSAENNTEPLGASMAKRAY